jgi:hypothetical protein
MRKLRAPSHDLCARMRYVPAEDSAWRTELIESECSELGVEKYGENGHPFWRYYGGWTRFDLDDPTLAPYLDRDAQPETWKFRRMSLEERGQVAYLLKQGREDEAWRHAFSHGVSGLEHAAGPEGIKLASLLQPGERTEKQRQAILKAAEDYSASAVAEVGAACYRGSQDLTPSEKKASG